MHARLHLPATSVRDVTQALCSRHQRREMVARSVCIGCLAPQWHIRDAKGQGGPAAAYAVWLLYTGAFLSDASICL